MYYSIALSSHVVLRGLKNALYVHRWAVSVTQCVADELSVGDNGSNNLKQIPLLLMFVLQHKTAIDMLQKGAHFS